MISLLSNVWKAWHIVLIFKKLIFLKSLVRRIDETGKSIKRALKSKAANLKFYPLAIDESTDATNMAQLAIFIRVMDT